MAGMTSTSNAPPIPANAVPASVTGHAGPRQSIVIPALIAAADTSSDWRRPRRSTTRIPQMPAISDANPNVEPCMRRNHTGNMELLAQLAEHGADAEAADQQGVAERRGVGEPIPPEFAGDQWGRTHTLFCTSKEDPSGGVIAERLTS